MLCLKKLQRKEVLFCFSNESEAGPIIQCIMTCGDYLFCSYFLENVNTVHICATRECYVMLETLKKGQLRLNSSGHSKVSMLMLMKIVFGQAKTRELVTVSTPLPPPGPTHLPHTLPPPTATAGY